MNKNSIEEEIEILEELRTHGYAMLLMKYEDRIKTNRKIDQAIEHILSDYKRVLKENEIYKKNSEIMSKENLSTTEQLKVEIKENFRLKNQLENNRKENQETYKDVREELKELKKENEELLQEKINNQKIIALAQNDMLNYQAGFEDGKNGRTSAVQSIIENQQYYIFQKQIEKYEGHIEKLQKENEECKLDVQDYLKQAQENAEMYRKAQKKIQDLKAENEELKKDYYNVINKIENKIDILDIAISECIYIDDDDKAYKKAVKKDKLCLLNQKRTLQELLEGGQS